MAKRHDLTACVTDFSAMLSKFQCFWRQNINQWTHRSPGRNVLWGFYQVTGWCVSLVSCSPERDFSVMLWQHAKEGYAKWKNTKPCQSTQTCWTMTGSTFLLALQQNSNSHEPAAWHALGCATSLSCHLQHIKPSVDYKNLCPLQSICRLNPWGLCLAAMLMDVSIMSPDVHPPNHLTDMWFEPLWVSGIQGKNL